MFGLYISVNHKLTININPLPHPTQKVKGKHDLVLKHCAINVCEVMEVEHHTRLTLALDEDELYAAASGQSPSR
jgi:hypothetical protein